VFDGDRNPHSEVNLSRTRRRDRPGVCLQGGVRNRLVEDHPLTVINVAAMTVAVRLEPEMYGVCFDMLAPSESFCRDREVHPV
jgi:hypothetical protein